MAVVLKPSTARELRKKLREASGVYGTRDGVPPRDLGISTKVPYQYEVVIDGDYTPTANERRVKVRGGRWTFGIAGYETVLEIESSATVGDFAGDGPEPSDFATTTVTIADAATKYIVACLASSTNGGVMNADTLAITIEDSYPAVVEVSGYPIVDFQVLAKVSNSGGVLTILPIWRGGDLTTIVSNPHRFLVSRSDTKGAVDVSEGSWFMNGASVTDTGGTSGIGSTSAPYIIATITHGSTKPLQPASITVSAASTAASADDFATKRTLAKIEHDGSGHVDDIIPWQLGDIYQNLNAIEVSSWSDGGKTGTTFDVVTDIQWDSSAHKLQMKKRECEIRSGVLHVGAEDSTWTDILTAVACP